MANDNEQVGDSKRWAILNVRRGKDKKAAWCAFLTLVILAYVSSNPSSSQRLNEASDPEIIMQVIVQVSANVARAIHQRSPLTGESEKLLRIIKTFGLMLEPMHHDTDDPTLQSYFIVEVPDHATAQRLIDHLEEAEVVEAAYLQPVYGLP